MKSNINRKYLHRRKNWFQRNWGYLLFWLVIIVVTASVVYGIIYFLPKLKATGLVNDGGQKMQSSSVEESTTRQVTWYDSKEEEVKSASLYYVDYTAPENAALPYYIKVNRALNCVTVYGIDSAGQYSIPVRAFVASVGAVGDDSILGEDLRTTYYYDWRSENPAGLGMYVSRINYNNLFTTMPYGSELHNMLNTTAFNTIGISSTITGVYLCARDAKWIYDNCPAGTGVTVYDDASSAGPLGKPEMIKIPEDSVNAGWDPTDPEEENPWLKCSANITGVSDITTNVGESVDLLSGVKATDTCGNDITDDIQVVGRYTFDQAGEYDITLIVTDLLGSRFEKSFKLTVR